MTFRQFGINTIFVDPDNTDNFRNAITKNTKAIYAEIMGILVLTF